MIDSLLCRSATLAGGLSSIALGAVFPWTEITRHGTAIAGENLTWFYGTALLLTAVGSLLFAIGLVKTVSNSQSFDRVTVFVFIFVFLMTVAPTWYGFFLPGSFTAYEYRLSARTLFLSFGSLLVAGSFRYGDFSFIEDWLCKAARNPRRFLIASCGFTLVMSSAIAVFVLDAMPHMSDALTYLMQGRIYWSGRLAIEAPTNITLLTGTNGFFFTEGPQGFFGKYPPGWPLVLGFYDLFGMSWLAAPVAACGILLVSFTLVSREVGRNYACLATLMLAGCPWLWFNAATQMSHVLSTFLLWGFIDRFMAMQRWHPHRNALLAGVFLGFAVITRPQDAFFFTLPAIAYSAWNVFRWKASVAVPSILVALSAIPGLIAYFVLNRYYMGGVMASPYGDSLLNTLFYNPPQSLTHWLSWLHQNMVMVNQRVYAGTLPVVGFVAVSMIYGWSKLYPVRLPLVCVGSFLFFYSFVIFFNRTWVGPRWLVPVLPMITIILAVGLRSLKKSCGRDGVPYAGRVPQLFLRYLIVSLVVGWLVGVTSRLTELRLYPPHNVDGRVVEAVRGLGLRNAIVGMDLTGQNRFFKDPRAGMAMMSMPLTSTDVIFVKAQANWIKDATESWPGRSVYYMSPDVNDYSLKEVQQ